MDTLIEIAVAILGGGLSILLFRLLKPKSVTKQNQEVTVKVEDKEKENAELRKTLESVMKKFEKDAAGLETEKNKDLSPKETEDFFNNRK